MYELMFRNANCTEQISYELEFCVNVIAVSVSQMSLTSVVMPPVALHLPQFRADQVISYNSHNSWHSWHNHKHNSLAGTPVQTASKQTGGCTKDIAELVTGSAIGIPGGSTTG